MPSATAPGRKDTAPLQTGATVASRRFSEINGKTMPHTPQTNACPAGRQKSLLRWCWILFLLATIPIAAPTAAQKGKPLAEKDVRELLKGSVPSSEIARLVTENGIAFRMSDALESQFREAGATDELLDALRKASKAEETTPPAPATGTLKIQSQPGEAQVYIDDEPKGTTSPEGDLRLAGLAPGTHRLRVSRAGYKTWQKTVTVTAGETLAPFVTLEKQAPGPSVILDTDRSSIESGQSVYLRWTCINATEADIEPDVGKVALAGASSVSPRESTTYTLTAVGPGGIKTATTSVSVTPPPPPQVVQTVVGNLPGFPVAGASFKEIKFFASGHTLPPLSERTYQVQFDHRTTRYVAWELHITCPPVASRVDFTIYATWYYPNGTVFGSQTLNTYADAGLTEPVYSSGRGWQHPGMWKRGTYRVDLFTNGSRIGSGSFTIY